MREVLVIRAFGESVVIPVFHYWHALLRRNLASAVRGMMVFDMLGLSALIAGYRLCIRSLKVWSILCG